MKTRTARAADSRPQTEGNESRAKKQTTETAGSGKTGRELYAPCPKLSTKCRQLERQKWELLKKLPFLHRLYRERGLPSPLALSPCEFFAQIVPRKGITVPSRALPMRVRLVLYGFVYSLRQGALCSLPVSLSKKSLQSFTTRRPKTENYISGPRRASTSSKYAGSGLDSSIASPLRGWMNFSRRACRHWPSSPFSGEGAP